MMISLILAAVLSSNASGKTLTRQQPGTIVTTPGYLGPLIADDPGTVAHDVWSGSTMIPVVGPAWPMQGTVPQVARNGKTPAGAGPCSDANYYSSAAASDVTDLSTADFSACFVLTPSAADLQSPFAIPFSNGVYSVSGYYWQWTTGGTVAVFGSTATNAITLNSTTAGTLSVVCMGRSGTSLMVKLNGGALVSSTPASWAAGTGITAMIGRYGGATGRYMTGTIHEAWWSTTTASDALFTAIMQRVKLRAQITAW